MILLDHGFGRGGSCWIPRIFHNLVVAACLWSPRLTRTLRRITTQIQIAHGLTRVVFDAIITVHLEANFCAGYQRTIEFNFSGVIPVSLTPTHTAVESLVRLQVSTVALFLTRFFVVTGGL